MNSGGEGMNGGGPSRSPGYPPGRERGAGRQRRSDPVPPAVHALPTLCAAQFMLFPPAG
jgi:hypothetical protein